MDSKTDIYIFTTQIKNQKSKNTGEIPCEVLRYFDKFLTCL